MSMARHTLQTTVPIYSPPCLTLPSRRLSLTPVSAPAHVVNLISSPFYPIDRHSPCALTRYFSLTLPGHYLPSNPFDVMGRCLPFEPISLHWRVPPSTLTAKPPTTIVVNPTASPYLPSLSPFTSSHPMNYFLFRPFMPVDGSPLTWTLHLHICVRNVLFPSCEYTVYLAL